MREKVMTNMVSGDRRKNLEDQIEFSLVLPSVKMAKSKITLERTFWGQF